MFRTEMKLTGISLGSIGKPKDLRLENQRKNDRWKGRICVYVFETNLLGAPKAQSGEHHSLG